MSILLIIITLIVTQALVYTRLRQLIQHHQQATCVALARIDCALAPIDTQLHRLAEQAASGFARLSGVEERVTYFEQRPAEVVRVEVPVVPDAVVQRGLMTGPGPVPKDLVTIIFRNTKGDREVTRVQVEKRRRAPQISLGDAVYAASCETAEGWVYRQVGGR